MRLNFKNYLARLISKVVDRYGEITPVISAIWEAKVGGS